MKKARKLLVTLLLLTFVLSTFSVGFAADAEEKLPTEVVRAQALGILKGDAQGNLNLDKPITRAEALALIIRISGLEKSAELMKGQTRFSDVNAAPGLQWATGYINLGVGQGIVNGYPDGSFQGNKEVTYAEMAKMLLYAMNYGVTVEGAQWPAGVMGKADDLKVFDKVNALPNVPALRGDVVKMIDNSLTVKHLKQTGYGDLKQYEEGEDSFLSKLDVEELKGYKVTKIAKVSGSKLDDDEIQLTKYDKNGKVDKEDIYTLKADASPEELFGLEVDAWANDDDEVFFVKVKTADKDLLYDSVVKTDKDIVELKVADKEYDWADNAVIYQNFKEVKPENVDKNVYGRVVLEKGEVIFANFFKFDDSGIVKEVKNDIVKYRSVTNTNDEIDLTDADDVYIYNADFSLATKKDIDKDTAIFHWATKDEYYIVISNKSEAGTVERIKDDSIKIDGTVYDKASAAIASLNEGKDFFIWATAENIKDVGDEKAKVVFDLNGEVIFVTSDAKKTSDDLYGIVTYASTGRKTEVTIFNQEGKEVSYDTEKRETLADIAYVRGSKDYFESFNVTGFVPKTASTYNPFYFAAVKYKLNADNEIVKNPAVQDMENNAIKISKAPDSKYITDAGSKRYYITEDTVIMQAFSTFDSSGMRKAELDPELVKYDKFVDTGFSDKYALVFGTESKNADFVVLLDPDLSIIAKDSFYGVVLEDPARVGKNYEAEIHVFTEGKKVYKLADETKFAEGIVVEFTLNNDDKAETVSSVVYGSYTYDNKYITVVGKDTYKVDPEAVLYSLDKKGYIDEKISVTKLANYKTISCVVDDKMIVAAVVKDKIEKETITGTAFKEVEIERGKVTVYVDIKKGDAVEVVLVKSGTEYPADPSGKYSPGADESNKAFEFAAVARGEYDLEVWVNDKLDHIETIRVR